MRMKPKAGGVLALVLAGWLAACGAPASTGGEDESQSLASASDYCVPVEEGSFYRVENGRLVAATEPQTVVVERIVEAPRSWTDAIEASFPDIGLPWLKLDARNVGAGVVTLTGLAPNEAAKQRALEAGEDAIKANEQGRSLLIVDGISVEGGGEAVGAALAELDESPSVASCQSAFSRVMDGRNVSFATGGAQISAESARLLDAATGVAILCKDHVIEIAGHTDSTGDAIANQRLSQDRANSVLEYLTERGVSADTLTARGYGESRPLDRGNTPAALTRNRRTEFIVRERL